MENSAVSSCEESLEALTAMLNQTLVDTGRFFRASGSTRSAVQLKRNLPSTHEQFQSALDNLSEQIFTAKAILEKDYTAIQEKKARAKSQPSAIQNTDQKDIIKKEPETVPAAAPPDQKPVPSPEANGKQPAIPDSKEEQQQQPTPKIKSEPQPQPQPVPAVAAAAAPQATEEPPSMIPPDNEPMNFDAMFPDTGPSTTNGIDLNMTFNDDESANQAFLASADAMNNTQNNDNNNGGGNNDASISSLLPGLESYASATGEEFSLDIPQQHEGNNDDNKKNQEGAGDNNNGNDNNSLAAAGIDTSMCGGEFDNLFLNTGGFGDDDMGGMDGMGNMEIGELDDSWL